MVTQDNSTDHSSVHSVVRDEIRDIQALIRKLASQKNAHSSLRKQMALSEQVADMLCGRLDIALEDILSAIPKPAAPDMTAGLMELRKVAAEKALSVYDFGLEVEGTRPWVTHEDHFETDVFLIGDDKARPFKVYFDPDTACISKLDADLQEDPGMDF